MKIRFKKCAENAVPPCQMKEGDAGFDLTAASIEKLGENLFCISSKIAVEIPEGYEGQIRARSSIFKKGCFLTNSVGTIDSGYRGEVKAVFYSFSGEPPYEIGERFAQLVINQIPEIEYEEAEELSESERGTGGYGSTGTK